MSAVIEDVEVGRVARMMTLRSFTGWNDLNASELAAVAAIARPCRVPAGAVVCAPDEPVTSLFLIVEGRVRARLGGRDLGSFGQGSGLAGLAAFARTTEPFEAVAEQDTRMLELDVAELEELFEDRFRVLGELLHALAGRCIDLRRRLPRAGFPATADVGTTCPARRLDLVERIFYLRKNLGMDGGIDSVAVLAHAAREIRLGPGETLWRTDDRGGHMVAILCGRVRGRTPEGARFELGAGDLAGSLDAIARQPRWYDCEVVDGLVALVLDHDLAMDVWEDRPDLALRMLSTFSGQVLELAVRPSTERVRPRE